MKNILSPRIARLFVLAVLFVSATCIRAQDTQIGSSSTAHANGRFWPNPFTDVINISLPDYHSRTITVQVTDKAGNVFLNQEVQYAREMQVSTTDLDPNVYIVRLISPKGVPLYSQVMEKAR